jgi:hypothetical protein
VCGGYNLALILTSKMPKWWNGRRARLKIEYREMWGFESPLRHHLQFSNNPKKTFQPLIIQASSNFLVSEHSKKSV